MRMGPPHLAGLRGTTRRPRLGGGPLWSLHIPTVYSGGIPRGTSGYPLHPCARRGGNQGSRLDPGTRNHPEKRPGARRRTRLPRSPYRRRPDPRWAWGTSWAISEKETLMGAAFLSPVTLEIGVLADHEVLSRRPTLP